MAYLITDSLNYFKEQQEVFDAIAGCKGINRIEEIKVNDLLLIDFTSRVRRESQVEQIYRVTGRWYETGNPDFPKAIKIKFVAKLDVPLTFKKMKELTPKQDYVKNSAHKCIGFINPKEEEILKNQILEDNPNLKDLL